jgi:tagaturonate reductase
MMLNKKTYSTISGNNIDALFALPEKVVQFGTGVLLRGLPDYFIDKANKQGVFNGRIVVVKSTDQGGTDAYAAQDGLYTLIEKGIENGLPIERTTINASISRVVSAKTEWQAVLDCAANPDIQIIISNTTEVGITLVASDVNSLLPESFPGKLLHFLMERYRVFNGSMESGLVVIPTELISDNGIKLKEIVIELAKLKEAPAAQAALDGFVYEGVKYQIQSFKFTGISTQRGYSPPITVQGSRLDKISGTLNQLRKGDDVKFTDIIAVGPGNKTVLLSNVIATLK